MWPANELTEINTNVTFIAFAVLVYHVGTNHRYIQIVLQEKAGFGFLSGMCRCYRLAQKSEQTQNISVEMQFEYFLQRSIQ